MHESTDKLWQAITVRDLVAKGEAEIKTGPFGTQIHASDYVKQGIPMINARNIGFGDIRTEKIEFVSEGIVHRLSSHLLLPSDIVFGRKGSVERHAFIRERHRRWMQGTDCLRLRLKSPEIEPRFVSYSLLTDGHKRWIMNQSSHGSTMTSLNQDIIGRISLRIPPLDIQRKIIDILSAYDDLIDNNLRRIKILEAMAQALYREWFVHFRFPGHERVKKVESAAGKVPEGWTPKTLGDIAQEVRRSVDPNSIAPETPYIGLEHLPRKSIALSDWGMAQDVSSTKLAFNRGEILFGKIRPYFHKVGVAPVDGVCSSDIIVIAPKAAEHFAIALCCVASEEFVNQATQTSQGTKMPRANWSVLVNYPVAIPLTPLLTQFNEFIEAIVNQLQNLGARNRLLRQTRDLLLPKLVSGEVSVNEAPTL